ncbi:MAG TPA: helix-turn-helix domain-containing protein [Methylovirgula sp.]|nr:helix-turn-helix domain-containing protein [Methylovirgula sp.]
MPGKADLSKLNCSVAGALNIVGDWWSLLILRDALMGVRRFSEFKQSLGLARNILADRLRRLVEDGVLIREGSERRPLYRPSEKGRALAPALIALMQWGDVWVSKSRPPVVVTDHEGRKIDSITLQANGRALSFDELRFEPGIGAAPHTRAFLAKLARRERNG